MKGDYIDEMRIEIGTKRLDLKLGFVSENLSGVTHSPFDHVIMQIQLKPAN